jgi:hypothetical protein
MQVGWAFPAGDGPGLMLKSAAFACCGSWILSASCPLVPALFLPAMSTLLIRSVSYLRPFRL